MYEKTTFNVTDQKDGVKMVSLTDYVPYSGDFMIDFNYKYVGFTGDKTDLNSLMYQSTLNSQEDTCYVTYGGVSYSGVGAVRDIPDYEIGKKLVIESVSAPEGYEIAWNKKPSVIIGDKKTLFADPQSVCL